MKIAVGSTSNQKIGYLEEVLKELEIKACLIPFEVSSEISSQPLSSQETKKGSINRAKKAFSNSTDCDFAIGIEVGFHPNKKGKYEMLCWSTIVDSKNKISSKSEKILLPDFYQNLIQKNEYLSDYVDEYLSKNLKTPYKYIATILKNRKPFIQTSVKTVIINYLIKNKYKLELDVQEPFLSFIKSGQKIVEGRLAKEKYLNLKKGDLIKINDVEVEVADIFKYKSFEEMIIKEGIKNVIPNANSLKGAVNVYYKFYSKEDENLFGVVAIKLRVIR